MGDASRATSGSSAGTGFRHEAFFYDSAADYVQGTKRFIEEGFAADDAILVAVPAPKAQLIRDGLGAAASSVQFINMAEAGRNPGRIIPLWLEFAAPNLEAGRSVRGIGEPIWAGRSAAALAECQWHESLLNLAFATVPWFPLMCPYDVNALRPDVLAEAKRSHPYLVENGRHRGSRAYRGAPAATDDFDAPLSPPPAGTWTSPFGPGDLIAVRTLVDQCAGEAGLVAHRVADLVVAVNEAATNSLRHGGGHGVLRVWFDAHAVVCQVTDGGRIRRALAGRHRRSMSAVGGRGLWLVHQLCDLVEVRSGEGGSTVRMSAYLG